MKIKKISSLIASLLAITFVNSAFAVDAVVTTEANVFIQGNNDSSAGTEGVFITSNSGGSGSIAPNRAGANFQSNGLTTIYGTSSVNIQGTTNINTLNNATTNIGGGTSVNNINGATTNINTATNIIGATAINSTGTANTVIGNLGDNNVTLGGISVISGATNGINRAYSGLDSAAGLVNAGIYDATFYSDTTMRPKSIINSTGVNASSLSATSQLTNTGEDGLIVNANGKLVSGTTTETTASLYVTNAAGTLNNGIVVQESKTTISGGTTNASSMALNNNGATFSNVNNGGPVQVHGVADGTANFDAVNVQQLNAVKKGIAGVAAMNNIPALDASKQFNLGVGVGGFDGQTSFAVGANARLAENLTVKASVGHSFSSNNSNINDTTWGVGAALAW